MAISFEGTNKIRTLSTHKKWSPKLQTFNSKYKHETCIVQQFPEYANIVSRFSLLRNDGFQILAAVVEALEVIGEVALVVDQTEFLLVDVNLGERSFYFLFLSQ